VEWYDKAIVKGNTYCVTLRQELLNSLDETARDRVFGCVQRNKWLENVKQSVESEPSFCVWVLAVEKIAAGTQNKWACLSPTFLCLKELMPLLLPDTKKLIRKRMHN
jgi:hypothetical protein